MKNLLRTFLVLVAIVGGTFAGRVYNHLVMENLSAATAETTEIQQLTSAAPVKSYLTKVVVDTPKYQDSSTGNLIRSDLVLTNWHALRSLDKGRLIVELADGTAVLAKVLKTDEDKDLALLELAVPSILPTVCLAPQEPVKDQPLTVAGFAKGHEYREVTGKVVGRRSATKAEKGPGILFLMDCCVTGGMSGSAAVDANGQLAGVIFGCKDGFTYGAGVDTVREFLQGTKYWEN